MLVGTGSAGVECVRPAGRAAHHDNEREARSLGARGASGAAWKRAQRCGVMRAPPAGGFLEPRERAP